MSSLLLVLLALSLTSANKQKVAPKDAWEKRVEAIYKRYLNRTDNTYAWKCFVKDVAAEYDKKPEYFEHAQALRKNAEAGMMGAMGIGTALQEYRNDVPPSVKAILSTYKDGGLFSNENSNDLYGILQFRVNLNEKIKDCNKPVNPTPQAAPKKKPAPKKAPKQQQKPKKKR